MSTKPPTPQGISRLLKSAGFARAEQRAGGFNSEGFHVIRNRWDDGIVLVNWWADSSADTDRERHKLMLDAYEAVLAQAGYVAELRLDKFRRPDYLFVSAKPNSEPAPKEG